MNEERQQGSNNLNYLEMVKKWIEAYDTGDETIVLRIQQTLLIDGMTKPSREDIKKFLGQDAGKESDK